MKPASKARPTADRFDVDIAARSPSPSAARRVSSDLRDRLDGRDTVAVFVDAVEYSGEDVPPVVGAARMPLRHHAYDTDTGRLAHGPDCVRVGFPSPSRSWAALPPRARRCTACSASVTRVVAERIHRQLSALVNEQFPIEKEKP